MTAMTATPIQSGLRNRFFRCAIDEPLTPPFFMGTFFPSPDEELLPKGNAPVERPWNNRHEKPLSHSCVERHVGRYRSTTIRFGRTRPGTPYPNVGSVTAVTRRDWTASCLSNNDVTHETAVISLPSTFIGNLAFTSSVNLTSIVSRSAPLVPRHKRESARHPPQHRHDQIMTLIDLRSRKGTSGGIVPAQKSTELEGNDPKSLS
jgi:hypothetical protein